MSLWQPLHIERISAAGIVIPANDAEGFLLASAAAALVRISVDSGGAPPLGSLLRGGILASPPAPSTAAFSVSQRWTDSVIRDVLPNGLTLLVQRDSSVPVVAVVTHVRAGYFDEPDRWAGIAHVLEHMFFKGTTRHGPGALARETQRLGGYLNASTTYDRTVYAVVPSADDGLAKATALQADALMAAALDSEELARELEVVIQEARRKLDTPEQISQKLGARADTLYPV